MPLNNQNKPNLIFKRSSIFKNVIQKYKYTRLGCKAHRLTKILKWNANKWGLFFHIISLAVHFSHWCCNAWIPLVKKVIKSRYEVIIWIFQPMIFSAHPRFIMPWNNMPTLNHIFEDCSKSSQPNPERRTIAEHFCCGNTLPLFVKLENLIQISLRW